MRIRKTAFFLLLLMPAAFCHAGLSKSTNTVRISYFSGGFHMAPQAPVRQLLDASTSYTRMESADYKPAYYNKNCYLLRWPESMKAEELRFPASGLKKIAEVPVLETAYAIVVEYPYQDPRAARPLLEGIGTKQGVIYEADLGGGQSAVLLALDGPPGEINAWFPTVALELKLDGGGKEAVVHSFAKPFGGWGRNFSLGKKRFAEDPPDLKIAAWLRNGPPGPAPAMPGGEIELYWPRVPDSFTRLLNELEISAVVLSERAIADAPQMAAYAARNGFKLPPVICSNVEISSAPLSDYIRPYAVVETRGLRIGVIAVLNQAEIEKTAYRSKLPFKALSARDGINRAIAGLRKERTDLIMLFFFAQGALDAGGQADVIVTGPQFNLDVFEERSAVLKDWRTGVNGRPALTASMPRDGLGELNVTFNQARSVTALSEKMVPAASAELEWNEHFADETDNIRRLKEQPTVLPQPNKVWPQGPGAKINYTALEAANLKTNLLRKYAHTEVALVKIRPLRINMPGDVAESAMRDAWIGPWKIALARMKGAALLDLAKRIDFGAVPEAEPRVADYFAEDWLSASGISADGKVGGFYIKRDEYYTVAMPEDLLAEKEAFPALKEAVSVSVSGDSVADAVISSLAEMKRADRAGSPYYRQLAGSFSHQDGNNLIWRLNVKNIALQFSETAVNNTQYYSNAPNARLRSSDQVFVKGRGEFGSELYIRKWTVYTSLLMEYGKVVIRPVNSGRLKNETADDIWIQNEFRYKLYDCRELLGGLAAGLFFSAGYDTEFHRNGTVPRRKILRAKSGFKLFEGKALHGLYLAAVLDQDYTYGGSYTKLAWEAGFDFTLPFKHFDYDMTGMFRNFSPGGLKPADLKTELELDAKIKIRLVSNLALSPFVSYYSASGAAISRTASNTMAGISLEYSGLFKPKR